MPGAPGVPGAPAWIAAVAPCKDGWFGVLSKSAAVGARIVNELPLVVVIFLIKYPDGFIFAGAGYSHDRAAAEDLRAVS